MTVTYNQKEAEKELSIKEMQEKTIVVQNEKKIKTLEVLICIDVILAFISFIISSWTALLFFISCRASSTVKSIKYFFIVYTPVFFYLFILIIEIIC